MKLRDKEYYPDNHLGLSYFSGTLDASQFDSKYADKEIIALPRSLHTFSGPDSDAEYFYRLVGMTIVDSEKSATEIAAILPDGWKIYEDNHYGYWSVLCNERDQVVFDLFIKRHFWCTEDEFVRFADKDMETIEEFIYAQRCRSCPRAKHCHDECITCEQFDYQMFVAEWYLSGDRKHQEPPCFDEWLNNDKEVGSNA